MEKSYFRSYIRRYACTPEEIMNALKKSGDNQDQILQEVSSSQADYSTEFNQEDEEMNATACPTDETFQFRCENGGLCFHDGMIPFCHCINGYTGNRCQYYWNNDIHGAAIAAPEVQSAALTTMLTIIIIGLILAFGLVYFSKTYCKARDLRDYMYPASVIDEETLAPVMVYPFTRRNHCCTHQHHLVPHTSPLGTTRPFTITTYQCGWDSPIQAVKRSPLNSCCNFEIVTKSMNMPAPLRCAGQFADRGPNNFNTLHGEHFPGDLPALTDEMESQIKTR